jgi:hypothetical protein
MLEGRYELMKGGPTDCRSAAASALEQSFKKPLISRAKRSAATAGWAAGFTTHFHGHRAYLY